MDYFIIVVTTVAGLYFHWWLYVRIKRWMDRDLALSLAGKDERKTPSCCSNWRALARKDQTPGPAEWLEAAAAGYPDQ
jgi:hypothetical protein